jgi:hypothetical protein
MQRIKTNGCGIMTLKYSRTRQMVQNQNSYNKKLQLFAKMCQNLQYFSVKGRVLLIKFLVISIGAEPLFGHQKRLISIF